MSDSREAALEKLQQDLDEIKADATYKGKTAIAFEAFHDHALRIFGNGRLHAQRQLILEVVAEVVASLDHFWSEGFVERPSTTELYRRLNEIISKADAHLANNDALGPPREWSSVQASTHVPHLERTLEGMDWAYRDLGQKRGSPKAEFCRAVRSAAKRWAEHAADGANEPAQVKALDALQETANDLRDIRSRGERQGLLRAALVDALDDCIRDNEQRLLRLVQQAGIEGSPVRTGGADSAANTLSTLSLLDQVTWPNLVRTSLYRGKSQGTAIRPGPEGSSIRSACRLGRI